MLLKTNIKTLHTGTAVVAENRLERKSDAVVTAARRLRIVTGPRSRLDRCTGNGWTTSAPPTPLRPVTVFGCRGDVKQQKKTSSTSLSNQTMSPRLCYCSCRQCQPKNPNARSCGIFPLVKVIAAVHVIPMRASYVASHCKYNSQFFHKIIFGMNGLLSSDSIKSTARAFWNSILLGLQIM